MDAAAAAKQRATAKIMFLQQMLLSGEEETMGRDCAAFTPAIQMLTEPGGSFLTVSFPNVVCSFE